MKMAKKSEASERLTELGQRLVAEIEKEKNPSLDVPIRNLSNISFDRKTKLLKLGRKTAKRYFFNVGHAKKFVQTLEAARIAKNLLAAGKHASPERRLLHGKAHHSGHENKRS